MNFREEKGYFSLIGISEMDSIVEYAASILKDGGVVLTPTDTVYGLICIPDSTRAVETVFQMKQRPMNRRLPIITADQEQAERELPIEWNDAARALANHFWPGAMTIACGIRKNNIGWLAVTRQVSGCRTIRLFRRWHGNWVPYS